MRDGIGKPLCSPTGCPATCDGLTQDCAGCTMQSCPAWDLVDRPFEDDLEDYHGSEWSGHLLDWSDVPKGRCPP